MLNQVCAKVRNYFTQDSDKLIGDYSIENGEIQPSVPLLEGQYYRIVGSVFNDGVHQAGDELEDEPEFHGAVWLMRVPKDFLQLVEDIETWQAKYGDPEGTNMSPFSSESFGGYSYTKAQGYAATGGGMLTTWESLFAARLNQYRKIRI